MDPDGQASLGSVFIAELKSILLQMTEHDQRVDTAIERWLGRNVTCLILGPDHVGMSGHTSVWVVKPMSAHEWWLPGVHCDAKVLPSPQTPPSGRKDCRVGPAHKARELPCLSIKSEFVWQIARVWPALADLGCLGV